MKRTVLLFPLTIVLTLFLAGCGADDDSTSSATATAVPAAMVTIDVRGFTYTPAAIEITAGTTITWTNADQILHTVTSGTSDNPDGLIDGQMTVAGETTSYTFDTPGTVTYFCSRHPFMQGEVVVR